MTTLSEVLNACCVIGNVIKLPAVQLERKLYVEVQKSFVGIGGKWVGGKILGFVFDSNPTDLLEELRGGKKRNLKKEAQAFFTPHDLALMCVKHLEIDEDDLILEPSAGVGAMIKAIREFAPDYKKDIDCCELMDNHYRKLHELGGVNIVGTDFMQFNTTTFKYDKIIANPPFNKNQDITHIQHMYELLDDNGKLVTLSGVGWMYGSVAKPKAFRRWLDDNNVISDSEWHLFCNLGGTRSFNRKNGDDVYIEVIPSGAFKESGTMVATCLITIKRYGSEVEKQFGNIINNKKQKSK